MTDAAKHGTRFHHRGRIGMINELASLGISRAVLFPIATAALALGIFVADALSPPDCVVSGLYVVVILISGRFCRGSVLRRICFCCVGLTVLAQFLSYRSTFGNLSMDLIGSFNAAVGIVAIVLTYYLLQHGQLAEEATRQAQIDLAHVSRVTTMGELTASIAHEINQPITGVVTNAGACLRWLAGDPPRLEEARDAATRIVRDGTRAAEIVSRIRQIFTKGTAQRKLTNLNSLARETIELLSSEISRYAISVRADLADDIPHIMADPVQLQQVMVNLIVNGIDAMKDQRKKRELILTTWRTKNGGVAMSISDTGRGLPSENMERIFETFFTTKSHGSGMGLSISRSIIEAHYGALSAAPNHPHGAIFQFILPNHTANTEA